MLRVTVGDLVFLARPEEAAPQTMEALAALLPLRARLIQARWSGEAAWIPLGARHLPLAPENATHYPGPGQLLLYPGGLSETEVLVPYGPTAFGSKMGPLAGNHFATIVAGGEALAELGRRVVWQGAQDIVVEGADAG